MKVVSEKVSVLDKRINEVDKNGSLKTYYNVVVGGMGFSHNLGVPKDVFDSVDVDQEIALVGQVGFKRDGSRFWYFDKLYSGK